MVNVGPLFFFFFKQMLINFILCERIQLVLINILKQIIMAVRQNHCLRDKRLRAVEMRHLMTVCVVTWRDREWNELDDSVV